MPTHPHLDVFLVYAHPEPRSFNGALARIARETLADAGHRVCISDLHAMGFDPVSGRHNFTTTRNGDSFKQQAEELHATDHGGFAPEVEGEMEKLEACDLMIWQFPLWWFGLPGLLKGWVDRVFAMGRIYGRGRYYETGVFRGKRAMLSLTTGSSKEELEPGGDPGDLMALLWPIHYGMLRFVGFDVLQPHVVHAPARLTDAERRQALESYAERLGRIHEEEPITVDLASRWASRL